ncbi:hypothetical protein [Methylobacterium sp.]|uniref:hypothetical protein n=1 Tax=Methylobacterium sp. TaxID=409 RepID=UPI003B02D344
MSVVTGMVLCMGCSEEETYEDGPLVLEERINAWLAEREAGSLARVERDFGGPKHPQMLVAGIGYRTLLEEDEAALVSFILGLPWVQPDRLILIVNPEDGDMQIHRPTAADRVIEHGTPS